MKIQYYPIDLADALGIGEIYEMKIDISKGVPVLQIDCEKLPEEKYKTIKSTKKAPAQKKPEKQESEPEPKKEQSFLVRLLTPSPDKSKKKARRYNEPNEPPPKRLSFEDMDDRFIPPF